MSGLLAAHRLQQVGVEHTILEKHPDVGGTWLANTYPGCRVDVPNHFYSYSFAQSARWPQFFSTQPALLEYFQAFAAEQGLRDCIRFGTERGRESCRERVSQYVQIWVVAGDLKK